MRCHVRRVTLWAVAAFCMVMFLGSLMQSKSEFDYIQERSQKPWGMNFHEKVHHLHAGNISYLSKAPMLNIPALDVRIARQFPQQPDGKHDFFIKNASHHHKRSSVAELGREVWPSARESHDRIMNQLRYKPDVKGLKKILVYNGMPNELRQGQKKLIEDQCSVTSCTFTSDRRQGEKADAVLWQQGISHPYFTRPRGQIWIMFYLESPHHTPILKPFNNELNWTATYRRDSVIVTPYEKFVHFKNFTKLPDKPIRNYAKGKTKKVAWFVSNCHAPNGRLEFVKELQKYITVDIYGGCGPYRCSRNRATDCYRMLSEDYKFYLAFENSNCKDYITEKLYWNALLNDIVPVVMGARPEDYKALAPPSSYIHVDDYESPQALAQYLHKLDQNDHLYNQYLLWKGTGEFINTKFWCRLCAMVHAADQHPMWYTDLDNWWSGKDVCINPGKLAWATWRGVHQTNTSKHFVHFDQE